MRTTKQIAAAMLAGTLLAGCSSTEPGVSFKSGTFECSKVGAKFEINPKVADFFLKNLKEMPGTSKKKKPDPPSVKPHAELEQVIPLMTACLQFLSNKPLTGK